MGKEREKKSGFFPFPGTFPFEYGLNKVLLNKAFCPGPIDAASRQQFYKRGAKIKSFALMRCRNQFLLLVGFFLFSNLCSFPKVTNMLPFEEKKPQTSAKLRNPVPFFLYLAGASYQKRFPSQQTLYPNTAVSFTIFPA